MSIVPKIKIEITFNELSYVSDALSELNSDVISNAEKAIISILQLVTIKLLKKQIANRHETKAFKLALEYHEAYFLECYLIGYNNRENAHYIQTAVNKLNQKLA